MQITSRDNTQFEFKSKDSVVRCDQTITIGDYLLPGPGEYEVSGVMAEASDVVTRLYVEDFTIGYIHPRSTRLSDHELEALGAVDVLIFPIGTDGLKEKDAASLIAQVEAPIMLPFGTDDDAIKTFCKESARCERVASPLKLSRTSLSTEGSRIIIFGGD